LSVAILLSVEQTERALSFCDAVRSLPGMWIAHFDWFTADAFWSGYLLALDPNALSDFRAWGLEYIGAPDSNTSPVFELQRRHGLPADNAGDASWTRARATEVAELVCDVVAAYVRARSL
jgi:hypothetical protein